MKYPAWTYEVADGFKEAAARIEQLKTALAPFAKAAAFAEEDEADNYWLAGSSARHALTIGDLRKAAEALKRR